MSQGVTMPDVFRRNFSQREATMDLQFIHGETLSIVVSEHMRRSRLC